MGKRRLVTIFTVFLLIFGIAAMWSAQGDGREGDTDTNIISANGSLSGTTAGADKKSNGNKVAKIFKAPFKAFGKLFGRKNNNVEQMSEKDIANFESTGVVRIQDNTSSSEKYTPELTGSGREHFEKGREFLNNGKLNEAIAELSLATSIDPGISEAYNLMGVAFDRKGMHERAKDAYEKALRSQPKDAQTMNNIGYSLYLNGNYRAAVDRLKRAAKLAPNDERIHNNLALALCRLGKYDEALKHFTKATGEFDGRMNTAAMLERAGRDIEATSHYEAARRIQPNSTVVLRRLSDLYQKTGQKDLAEIASRDLANAERESVATNR
jgi:Flp pilus assembly protein TadD